MARFGQTWWGSQWLNALAHIDFSNRLPRGSAYARNGSVRDIRITGSAIEAWVQGNSPMLYMVHIQVPVFSKSHKNTLLQAIKQSPLVLSRLLNRELPGRLHDLARDNGIRLFPQSWNDLDMSCSCPDSAVPCKHLAAVIYMIADEIDRNPFLVFKLHELDILEKLEAEGFATSADKATVPEVASLLSKEVPPGLGENVPAEAPDLSTIPLLRDSLLSLLADNPLFQQRSFKPVLKKAFTRIAKKVSKMQQAAGEQQMTYAYFTEHYEKYNKAEVLLTPALNYDDTHLHTLQENSEIRRAGAITELINYLNAIPPRYAPMLSHYSRAIYFMYHYALKLLEQSAFIPQIVRLTNGSYFLRWIPAYVNAEVKQLYNQLARYSPKDLAVVIDDTGQKHYVQDENQVEAIVSVFLNYYVENFYGAARLASDPEPTHIDEFFFRNIQYAFSGPGESEIPTAIHHWLSPFFIAYRNYVPLLKVLPSESNWFEISLLVENRKNSLQEPISLKRFMQEDSYRPVRLGVLQALARLAEWYPDIEQVLDSHGEGKLLYNSDDFAHMLSKILPAVRMLGIAVLLPNELKHLARPRPTLSLQKAEGGNKKPANSLEDLLDFQWQVAVGDEVMDADEFRSMVEGLSGVVHLKNQYVLIKQEDIQQVLKQLEHAPDVKRSDLVKAAITGEWEGARVHIPPQIQEQIEATFRTREIDLPNGIKAHLRPYQYRGYQWLYRNLKIGFGSIIADDMGLGKTLQVIAMLLAMKNEGLLHKQKAIAVVPTTLLTNWGKEIEKFAPDISYSFYHGPSRELNIKEADLLITTYGVVRSDEEKLQRIKWELVIIDEAQHIKNPGSGQSKAVKKLKAPAKIGMSGTPVENRLSEYWSIFDFVNKGYLGSLKSFTKNYARPIENDRNEERLRHFRQITAPFIMRRMKTDKTIINELPDKVENDYFTHLTKEQGALYQNVVDSMMQMVEQAKEKDKEEEGQINRLGAVLKMMTALKQVCNHPAHYLKKKELDPGRSGKTQMLLNLLETIYESGEKVLLFTQYKEMGSLLQEIIEEHFHNKVLFLHGGVPRKQRDGLVEQFQNRPHLKTFILSIKAGGTGLNLTAANHVIHYDLWWNPAVESQATDRTFRIGQDKNVMVYRLITRGTFEEKVNDMLKEKKELANLTVAKGEKWLGDLSGKELSELVALNEE